MQASSIRNPDDGEHNDSLTGDFIWSNVNVGEAVSDVMTPLTWSIFNHTFRDITFIPGYSVVGNICGRIYNNVSLTIKLLRLSGRNPREFGNELGGGYEQFQDWISKSNLSIPTANYVPLVRNLVRFARKQSRAIGQLENFLRGNPKWCQEMSTRLKSIQTGPDLADFWEHRLAKYGLDSFWIVFSSAVRYTDLVGKLREQLTRLVGQGEASSLLTCVSTEQELLASLGLLMGVWKIHRGQWTRKEFLEQYGHRSPYEDRSLSPYFNNGTEWLDELLNSYAKYEIDLDAMLSSQRFEYDTALRRLRNQHPYRARGIEKRLQLAATAARQREAVRSEFMRITFVITHPCAQKAGEITGLGSAVFFLTYQEIWNLLRGVSRNRIQDISLRRSVYERQRARPAYPPVIRGHFDPDQWLKSPNRHAGFFDSHETGQTPGNETGSLIKGMPGATGRVEGRVRCVDKIENANLLQPGEILVTSQTHVGWTPYFPHIAAVITDVGAPLSHAAIVARELGIPAVVGCRNATMLLKTGDRVRVDGGAGTVEVIERTG